ncbi:MAG: hypothetical protein LKI93_06415 [Bifidobacteriaceae bacterium]|nr:hypothetical protein [Bifidobacteriaceae bacterium]MCI1915027.1 hypothetical protein [Bifidobacteriaceae bacterium]
MSNYSRRWNDTSFAVADLERLRMEAYKKCVRFIERTWAKGPLVMSHTTALQLLGIEIPRLSNATFRTSDIHVCKPRGATRSRRNGVTFHTWDHPFLPRVVGAQVSCVPPVTAWAQMGRILSNAELVVLGDSMMRNNSRLKRAHFSDFEDFMTATPVFQGRKNCRAALKQMVEGTDSSQETRSRLLMTSFGLPIPAVNYQVVDDERAQIYSLDMAYVANKVGIEYDGVQHFSDPRQRDNDDFKRSRLRHMGWTIITITSKDLMYLDRWKAKVSEILEALQ